MRYAIALTHPTPVIQETFDGTDWPANWDHGGDASRPSGWLQLTSDGNNQLGWACYKAPFSSAQDIVIRFEYATYGGDGGEGFTCFLLDGATSSAAFRIGEGGGSLGYADGCFPHDGLHNAWLGVGFDERGDFARSRPQCEQDGTSYPAPDVTLRSSVGRPAGEARLVYAPASPIESYARLGYASLPQSGSDNASVVVGLDMLDESTGPPQSHIGGSAHRSPGVTLRGAGDWFSGYAHLTHAPSSSIEGDPADYRSVEIALAANGRIQVRVRFGPSSPWTTLIDDYDLAPDSRPASFKLGFAGSTSDYSNRHRIRNLTVLAAASPLDDSVIFAKSAQPSASQDVTLSPGAAAYWAMASTWTSAPLFEAAGAATSLSSARPK